MKKIGKIVLAFALIAVTAFPFAGCSDKIKKYEKMLEKHKGTVDLTVWTYYNNEQKTAFDGFTEDFNKTVGRDKGIKVSHKSHQSVPKLAEELEKSAAGKVGADQMPDMFQSYVDDLMVLNDKYDNVATLDKYFTKDELGRYVEGFLDEGRYDGKSLKLIPIAKSTEIFMLNKTDWDEFAAGWNGAHPDEQVSLDDLKTVEGIAAAAGKYYDWMGGGKALFGRDAMANYIFQSAASLGKELFKVQDGEGTVDFDEPFFKKLYDNYYVPYVRGWFMSSRTFRSNDVEYGDILAYVGSTSSAGYFPNEVRTSDDDRYPIDCYVTEVPVFAGADKYAIQQGAGIAVTKKDELTEYACSVFLKYVTDRERNLSFAAGMDYLPVVKDALEYDEIRTAYIDYNANKLLEKGDYADLESAKKAAEEKNRAVLDTYEKALGTAKTYTMYSPKPFVGSAGIRKIFDACMQGKKPDGYGMENLKNADDLLDEIAADTSGKPRAELIEQKLEGNFAVWFAELKNVVADYLTKAQAAS